MAEPKSPKKIEVPDIFLFAGLVFLFTGLAFAITWAWSLVICGVVMIILAVWLVEPLGARKDKA